MKEAYFTGTMLSHKANEMLESISRLRACHTDIAFSSSKSALLVLDMQEYFLDSASHAYIPCGPVIAPRISRLVDIFAQANRPVIFTQHSNSPGEAGMMETWWKDMLTDSSDAWRISSQLDPTKGIVLHKSQYDAFFNTELEAALTQAGISQIVISGVMTHLCCETTARSAFMRGFEVFFTIDGTATYNEAYHMASLINLSHGFAVPVLVEEIEEVFSR